MEQRINPMGNELGAKWAKYIISSNKVIADSSLPKGLQELVKIRASQINGCGGCLDMHTKDAAAAGESAVRINLVGAWRETTVYTDAERAALELTDQGTRLADSSGVTDEAWANAAKHFDEDELMALVALICVINAFNRLNVITKTPGGAYQPGQYA
ncbi:carboxymuconolactone decarboxylase family protein [Glycomyces artemisiae]|uniref:AhpD family alkylhydroperoxidase n=1 Tax=Glycomyces artemisiae TaxID=1076443 RepID=A0A2T0URK0_9ACTN|nr:carboxymuconolactone decarboxylase family protein [Glycomyces artemisiae]PRY60555.1 AhpD family alkylhydroperoxidase [Glycomyces artemisiae]